MTTPASHRYVVTCPHCQKDNGVPELWEAIVCGGCKQQFRAPWAKTAPSALDKAVNVTGAFSKLVWAIILLIIGGVIIKVALFGSDSGDVKAGKAAVHRGYDDCLSKLGYAGKKLGSIGSHFPLTITVEGTTIEFRVTRGNTGDVLAFPSGPSASRFDDQCSYGG